MTTLVGKTDGTEIISRVLILPINKEKRHYLLQVYRGFMKETVDNQGETRKKERED